MSSDQTTSNPLLSDPSIIQVLKEDGSNNENHRIYRAKQHLSGCQVEPGSALSKLLDSAIAKAAEESTPRIEPISRSNSPNTPMPTISQLSKKSLNHVYTIEFFIRVKKSGFC